MHAVVLLADWNVPAAHAAHSPKPALAAKVPGEHGRGVSEPVPHEKPIGHLAHSLGAVAPGKLRYEPAAHGTAAGEPRLQ